MNIIILVVFMPFSLLFICFVRSTFFPSRFSIFRDLPSPPPSFPSFFLSLLYYLLPSFPPSFAPVFLNLPLSLRSAFLSCCVPAFPSSHTEASWQPRPPRSLASPWAEGSLCGGSRGAQRARAKTDLFKLLALNAVPRPSPTPVKAIKLCDLFRSVGSKSKVQVENAPLLKWSTLWQRPLGRAGSVTVTPPPLTVCSVGVTRLWKWRLQTKSVDFRSVWILTTEGGISQFYPYVYFFILYNFSYRQKFSSLAQGKKKSSQGEVDLLQRNRFQTFFLLLF